MPLKGSSRDQCLLGYIRRVNLDLLWSREPATIRSNVTQLNKLKRIPELMRMGDFELERGPWPVKDTVGFRLAIAMLRASQDKGRHDPEYVQFDTIRKMRSTFSNVYESSARAAEVNGLLKGERGRVYRLTDAPSDSRFFQRFILGLESRMGRLVKSNIGIDVKILQLILRAYEQELRDSKVQWK